MAIIETDIDIAQLEQSGKRGRKLVKWAYEVLKYDGLKLLHTAIFAGSPHVDHIRAASMLGFAPATLRNWHSQANGPIQAIIVNGKPYWRIKDIRQLLGE